MQIFIKDDGFTPQSSYCSFDRKKEEIELQENETHITDLSALNVLRDLPT